MIREAREEDLCGLLELYLYLHEQSVPEQSEELRATWRRILNDEDHHVILWEEDGKIVSSCVCVVIPNLTRGVRPYALIENVVTHGDYRNRGYGTACLHRAKAIAKEAGCYKIMLLTGSQEESTLRFYRSAGFTQGEKTGLILRID